MAKETRKLETTQEGKKRSVKLIFNPISLIFSAGLGYMIYRQVRKRRKLGEQLPQGA